MTNHFWRRVCAGATFAMALAIVPTTAHAVIITPASSAYDTWIRQSSPNTVYQNDLMSVWDTQGPANTQRFGVVQWDLSGVATPITSAYIQLYNFDDRNSSITQIPATWVGSSAVSGDLSTFDWATYEASVQPFETSFTALGSGAFIRGQTAAREGSYETLIPASTADLAALNAVRTGDGKITVIFKASSGQHDWGDTDVTGTPARLIINEAPPETDNFALQVNRFSGAVAIKNPANFTGFSLTGYTVSSASGQLVPDPSSTAGTGWDSIRDSGNANFDEVDNSANFLSEVSLTSSVALAAGATRSLGKAFTPFGTEDIAFQYSTPDGSFVSAANVQYVGGLELQVKRLIGNGGAVEGTKVVLANPEGVGIEINGYEIASASGSLNPAGFNGYDGRNVAGWDQVGTTANSLAELNLEGSSTVGAEGGLVLGSAFTTGATRDLVFEYVYTPLDKTFLGEVKYQDVLSGDANEDGVIDIFDVNVVSDNWSQSGPEGDVNFDGVVDIFDVNVISDHWGNTLGGGVAAVPEPSSWAMLTLGVAAALMRWTRRGRISPQT